MKTSDFFSYLDKNFSTSDLKLLFPILRQDPIIWSGFQELPALIRMKEKYGTSPNDWSLRKLSFSHLGLNENILSKSVKEKLYLSKAIKLLEAVRNDKVNVENFNDSSLLALALYERGLKKKNWVGLIQELNPNFDIPRVDFYLNWRTAFAILFCLLDYEEQLLETLADEKDEYLAISLINHIVAVQLISENEKVNILYRIINNRPKNKQINWYQLIGSQLSSLGHLISEKLPEETVLNFESELDVVNDINNLDDLVKKNLRNGYISLLENSRVQAYSFFSAARDTSKNILATIEMLCLETDMEDRKHTITNTVLPLGSKFQDLFISKYKNYDVNELDNSNSFDNKGILEKLQILVKMKLDGEEMRAKEIAALEFANWLEKRIKNWPAMDEIVYMEGLDHSKILEYIRELGLFELEMQLLNFLEMITKNNLYIDKLARNNSINALNADKMYERCKVNLILNSADQENRKQLIKILNNEKDWDTLFEEWGNLEGKIDFEPEDWLNYANSACESDHLEEAKNLCSQLEQVGVEKGEILSIQGKTAFKSDQFEEALNLLNESISSAPKNKDAWLTLSKIYLQNEDYDQALATLRSAVLAVPDSDEIHAMLATVCLEKNLYAEALPYLRKAIALNAENDKYYVHIISTLKELGRFDEAYQLLNTARQKWPSQSSLAYNEAIKYIDEGNRERAIQAFKIAIENEETPSLNWLLEYSKILVNEEQENFLFSQISENDLSDLIEAQKVLQDFIKRSDDEFGSLLLAEVYYMLGETEAAHSIYLKLIYPDNEGENLKNLNWRVKAGLGLVKIGLGDIDSGLVMLKESASINANHIGIKHKLAEAYLQANLEDRALNVAREAFECAGTDINNLLWYADIMQRLNQKEEVLNALEQAYQLSNQNSALNVRLAMEYVTLGKTQDAIELLDNLLDRPGRDFKDLRNAAITYLRIGLNFKSLKAYNLALKNISSPSIENQIELAYLRIINSLWVEALPIVQNLIEKNPKYRLFHALEGKCLIGLNQYKAASSAFSQAIASEKLIDQLILKNEKLDLFVPQNWIGRYENMETLFLLIAQSSSRTGDFQSALKYIDYAIKSNPSNDILNLYGIDLSMQLNDYELANKYKLAISDIGSFEKDEVQISLMYGLFTVHSYLSDRENKIDLRILNFENEICKFIAIIDHLDKGEFIKGRDLFMNLTGKVEIVNNLTSDITENNGSTTQIWENTLYRLKTIAAMRLYEYALADEILGKWQLNNGCPLEISYYKANLILEYRQMAPVFEDLKATGHISPDLEKFRTDETVLLSSLELANGQGKTKSLKDLELIAIGHDNQDISRLQSILFSTSFPTRLKYQVISDLMKLNQFELVEQYLNTLSTQVLDFIMYGIYRIKERAKETLNMFEIKDRFCDPLFFRILSLSYKEITNYPEALDYSEKSIEYWQNEENWLIDNANLYELIGDSSTAIEIWKKIINKSPQKESVIYSYTDLLLNKKNATEVLELLGEHKKALYGSFDYFLTYAKASFQNENYENTIKAINEAKKINNEHLDLNLIEGNVFLKLLDYEKAFKKAEDIIKVDPAYEEAYLLKVSIFQAKNKLQEAIKAADIGLNHCQNGAVLKMVKANILRSIGRETEALQLASQISTADPTNFEALTLLANLYQELGDISAAEITAKKSVRISQNQPDLQLLLGRILTKKGNLDQALEYLSKSAAMQPDDVEACLEIGKVYLEQQDLASALDAYKAAIDRNSKDYRAYYQAGLIMKEIKDYQGAERMLKLAAEMAPKDANIRRQLAGVMALNFVHSPMEAN